ncbi:MAG TPA: VOC family protein [Ilumatobacteraceae bacterium]|nr:VOC family protein [Ilumatobacteraceae bacterium]
MREGESMVIGSFPDLCVGDVATSVSWYTALLDLDVLVDQGWYAELGVGGRIVVAFVQTGHETVPWRAGRRPGGILVSFEVDDATSIAARAVALELDVVRDLTVELGQRHFMVVEPDGAVVDVIERVPMERRDLALLAALRRRHAETASSCR